MSSIGRFDVLLSFYLSETTMVITAIICFLSIFAFIISRGKKRIRSICIVLIIYCVLYFAFIFLLSYLAGSAARKHRESEELCQFISNMVFSSLATV